MTSPGNLPLARRNTQAGPVAQVMQLADLHGPPYCSSAHGKAQMPGQPTQISGSAGLFQAYQTSVETNRPARPS